MFGKEFKVLKDFKPIYRNFREKQYKYKRRS